MATSDQEWAQRTEERFEKFGYEGERGTVKTSWPAGPWQEEPDRVEWRYHGTPRFPLLIVRNALGALCGYVGVPPGHPGHGTDYSNVRADVHGGLTFSDGCTEGGKICHVARLGESESYKTIAYVRAEVESLADQLSEWAKGG